MRSGLRCWRSFLRSQPWWTSWCTFHTFHRLFLTLVGSRLTGSNQPLRWSTLRYGLGMVGWKLIRIGQSSFPTFLEFSLERLLSSQYLFIKEQKSPLASFFMVKKWEISASMTGMDEKSTSKECWLVDFWFWWRTWQNCCKGGADRLAGVVDISFRSWKW